jgi:hypothetical protein
MFAELMDLAAGRTILITVARIDDATLCVSFIPRQLNATENAALATPLCRRGISQVAAKRCSSS